MTVGSSQTHQTLGTQDAIHGRKRDEEQFQIPRSHCQDAVGKVRVPLFDGHGRYSGAFLREKPVDGVLGAWLAIIRLWPRFQIPDHLTTRLRLIIHMAQARILDTPLALASSMLTRMALFCSSSIQRPSIFPTNPIRFFSKDRQLNSHFGHHALLFLKFLLQLVVLFLGDGFLASARTLSEVLQRPFLYLVLDSGQIRGVQSLTPENLSNRTFSTLRLQEDLVFLFRRGETTFILPAGAMNRGFYLCRLHSCILLRAAFGRELRSPYGLPSSPTEGHYTM